MESTNGQPLITDNPEGFWSEPWCSGLKAGVAMPMETSRQI